MNTRTKKKFKQGDTVTLRRQINLKDRSIEYPKGTQGLVIQVYQSSAVRVRFDDGRDPVIAAVYLA